MVDLPPSYSLILGREWSYPLSGYLLDYGSYIMLQIKHGGLTRIPHVRKKYVWFSRKAEQGLKNFLNMGLGNYVVLEDITNKILLIQFLIDYGNYILMVPTLEMVPELK